MFTDLYRKYVPIEWRMGISDIREYPKRQRALRDIKYNLESSEYLEECQYMIQRKKVCTFPYVWAEKYEKYHVDVLYDQDWEGYYVMHMGKKLYFPKGFSPKYIQRYYRSLLFEQDVNSSHRYFSSNTPNMGGKLFFDIGAAEGIITLNIIETIECAVLFEADERWRDALVQTFKPWKDKVEIISKYASNVEDESSVRLDSIAEKYELPIVIKMDVEGMEEKVLSGAEKTIERDNVELYVCVYHKSEAEEKIGKILLNQRYEYKVNEGYMFYGEPLGFRHGVLHAYKNF